jgi:hypothetical protein
VCGCTAALLSHLRLTPPRRLAAGSTAPTSACAQRPPWTSMARVKPCQWAPCKINVHNMGLFTHLGSEVSQHRMFAACMILCLSGFRARILARSPAYGPQETVFLLWAQCTIMMGSANLTAACTQVVTSQTLQAGQRKQGTSSACNAFAGPSTDGKVLAQGLM